MYDVWTDRHTDVQRETIIPQHYYVVVYKNDMTMLHNTWLLAGNIMTPTVTMLLKNSSATAMKYSLSHSKQNLTFVVTSYEIYETCQRLVS